MRVFGTFLVIASLLGFVVGLGPLIPEDLGLPLSSYFGELTKTGGEAVCVLSVCVLCLGVRLMTRQTSDQKQKPDPGPGSHLFNK